MSTIRESVKLTNAGKCINELKQERDTYRDLCAELIRSSRAKLEASNFNEHVKANFELEVVIIKAQSILGEKQ